MPSSWSGLWLCGCPHLRRMLHMISPIRWVLGRDSRICGELRLARSERCEWSLWDLTSSSFASRCSFVGSLTHKLVSTSWTSLYIHICLKNNDSEFTLIIEVLWKSLFVIFTESSLNLFQEKSVNLFENPIFIHVKINETIYSKLVSSIALVRINLTAWYLTSTGTEELSAILVNLKIAPACLRPC